MMLLYIETNYLMGVATGRYPGADDLLSVLPPQAKLCLPAGCVIEAFAALEGEQARRNALRPHLAQHIAELRSGVESPLAQTIVSQLSQVAINIEKLVNEFQITLSNAVTTLHPHLTLIDSTPQSINTALANPFCSQLTDNLILHTIVDYAKAQGNQPQAFFTANATDFGNRDALSALTGAGMSKLLKRYESLKQWLGSLNIR